MARNGHSERFESVSALTQLQKEYIKAIATYDNVVSVGPPGTGKTYLPSCLAAQAYYKGEVQRIILLKPNVPATHKEIGYLPGSANDKMSPWLYPITEVLEEKLGKKYDEGVNNGTIQLIPLLYLRGYTFRNSFIILDECSSVTIAELKLILTRIGEGSKIVITGDLSQTDIKEPNGLEYLIKLINHLQLPVPIITFTEKDIVRSTHCQMWVTAFNERI